MTDDRLKLALAKMLPEHIIHCVETNGAWSVDVFYWIDNKWRTSKQQVTDCEWLHVCWLVEQTLDDDEILAYVRILLEDVLRCFQGKFYQHFALTNASWQRRAAALCKVKGIEP